MKYKAPDGRVYDAVKIDIRDGVATVKSAPKTVVVIIADHDSGEKDYVYDSVLFERGLLK